MADYTADGTADGVLIVPGSELVGRTNSTITCKIVTSDSQGVLFTPNVTTSSYMGAFVSTSPAALGTGSGSPSYFVDGNPVVDRDELYDAIVDGEEHFIEITGIDFSSTNWTDNGLYFGGFNSSLWYLEATLTEFKLNGVLYPVGNIPTPVHHLKLNESSSTLNIAKDEQRVSGWTGMSASDYVRRSVTPIVADSHIFHIKFTANRAASANQYVFSHGSISPYVLMLNPSGGLLLFHRNAASATVNFSLGTIPDNKFMDLTVDMRWSSGEIEVTDADGELTALYESLDMQNPPSAGGNLVIAGYSSPAVNPGTDLIVHYLKITNNGTDILEYDFDQNSLKDLINSYDLTATGSPTLDGFEMFSVDPGSDSVVGLYPASGTALDFDGIDDYIEGPADITDYPFAIGGFVQVPSGFSQTSFITLTTSLGYFRVEVRADGSVRIFRNDGTTNDFSGQTSAGVVSADTPIHILAVFPSSTQKKLYVDGVELLDSSGLTAVSLGTPDKLRVAVGETTTYFEGIVDEAQLYGSHIDEDIASAIRDSLALLALAPTKPLSLGLSVGV